jgi:hypothetical protein
LVFGKPWGVADDRTHNPHQQGTNSCANACIMYAKADSLPSLIQLPNGVRATWIMIMLSTVSEKTRPSPLCHASIFSQSRSPARNGDVPAGGDTPAAPAVAPAVASTRPGTPFTRAFFFRIWSTWSSSQLEGGLPRNATLQRVEACLSTLPALFTSSN